MLLDVAQVDGLADAIELVDLLDVVVQVRVVGDPLHMVQDIARRSLD